MFGLLEGLVKTVVKTAVVLPISVVADVATLGGTLTDKRGRSYTGDAMQGIGKSLKEMSDD